jgi:hypothetical protein
VTTDGISVEGDSPPAVVPHLRLKWRLRKRISSSIGYTMCVFCLHRSGHQAHIGCSRKRDRSALKSLTSPREIFLEMRKKDFGETSVETISLDEKHDIFLVLSECEVGPAPPPRGIFSIDERRKIIMRQKHALSASKPIRIIVRTRNWQVHKSATDGVSSNKTRRCTLGQSHSILSDFL